MGNKDTIGKTPISKNPLNKNNTTTPPKSPTVRTSSKITAKQIPTHGGATTLLKNLSSKRTNENVTVDKNIITSSRTPSTSTSASTDAYHTIVADNHHDNLSFFDNQNVIASNVDNIQSNSLNSSKQQSSFASITANEKTPSREQAIVFNSIEGVRQIEYILAIGKLTSPRDIIFTSRISNNRFCIFLSSKEALETLLKKSKTISVNEHTIPIRRLINPAKKITISNVCPSIPNQTILDALKNINIIPVSQVTHIKAGINIEGYEHILSFRRQIFINHEDITKLPGSLVINSNQTQFRIFFTDDRITCFLCKAVGHTSASCKKQTPSSCMTDTNITNNIQTSHNINKTIDDHPVELLEDIQFPEFLSIDATPPQNIMDWNEEKQNKSLTLPLPCTIDITTQETMETSASAYFKRPLSNTSIPKSPTSPIASGSQMPLNQPDKKKAKIRSRSNSLTSTEDNKLDSMLKPAVIFFANSENSSVTLDQFKYFLENFRNPNITIHTLCNEISSNISELLDLIEKVRPLITDRSMKSKLTSASNLLFKTLPPK